MSLMALKQVYPLAPEVDCWLGGDVSVNHLNVILVNLSIVSRKALLKRRLTDFNFLR